MNLLYRPFIAFMSIAALGILFFEFRYPLSLNDFDGLMIIVIATSLLSEANYVFGHRSIRQALTAPLSIFLIFHKPLLWGLILTILYQLFSRWVINYRDGEKKSYINDRMLFNASQHIILLFLASLIINKIEVLPEISFIILLLIIVFFYNVLNIIMSYTVISLFTNKNCMNQIIIKNFVTYSFAYLMVLMALLFSYEAYDKFGLAVACFFVIQTQSSLLSNMTARELNDRLIKDRLTKAYNRNYFDEIVEMNLKRQRTFSILFIDLDDFKNVNDEYGHVVGDALLVDFVAILKNLVKPEHKIFRYGGDEFCILLDSFAEAEIVKSEIEKYVFVFMDERSSKVINYEISLGIFDCDQEDEITYEELIHKVDQNMYIRKRHKKKENELVYE